MKVVLASSAGFCMGVRRAVNLALDAARDRSGPIYTLGPLIHNPQVVSMLEKRGVNACPEAPGEGTVVIRSHGVTPGIKDELRSHGLELVDATCPRVARVHGIVAGRHKKGYTIVVLGDPGHAEVEGIKGYAEGQAHVIQSADQVRDLPQVEKLCLVAQTTQERERFEEVAKTVREKYKHMGPDDLVISDTICDSTRNRQAEVSRLARDVDAVVVVGGRQSANTRRLLQVARQQGAPAYLVETEADLDKRELAKYARVGLTAGASTPNWMIRRIYNELRAIRPRRSPVGMLRSAGSWLVLSNLYVAMGAGALTLAAARMQGFFPMLRELLVSVLFVFAVHTMTLLADQQALALNVPARANSFTRYRPAWIAASILAAALAIALAATIGLIPALIVSALAVASFLYPVRLIPGGRKLPIRSLAEVPAGKDMFMAIGWSVLVVLLPLVVHVQSGVHLGAALAALCMVFGLVLVRALLRDFRDIQADRLIGRETLPIVLGADRTRRLLYGVLVGMGLVMVSATLLGWVPSPLGFLMIAPMAYAAACVPLFTRQTIIQGFGAETVIDAAFLLAGLVAVLPMALQFV